jgi:hypothetical protein
MLLVVGGHSRNIGKTSVVAGLIAALPEIHWKALKITQYGHSVCSRDGEACECTVVDPEHPFAISEEHDAASGTDTGRFLAAGARRAYWVRTSAGQLGNALPALRGLLETGEHVIVESNSILQFIKPDLYLVVLDFATGDFKPSSLQHLDRADAIIVVDRGVTQPEWSGVAPRLWESKPRFYVRPSQWVTEAITELVRERLNSSGASSGVCSASSDSTAGVDGGM